MKLTLCRKTVNPRQGIETICAMKITRVRCNLCRKTVNPRQGIETQRGLTDGEVWRSWSRKTVNPRQGIETGAPWRPPGNSSSASEDSESSSGD